MTPRLASLRARLTLLLLALALATASVVAVATYRSVLREADRLFDYQLRQIALSVREQGEIDQARRAFDVDAPEVSIQIRSADGRLVYLSGTVAAMPLRGRFGFADATIGGEPWRVFTVLAGGRLVQVAQPRSVRSALAAAAAWRSVLPLLATAPLVAVAVWALVGWSLAPVAGVTAAVARRSPSAIEPLPQAGLPSEVAPLVDAFNALLGRLRSAFDAQRGFVADAAHELRSPLTALKLQLGELRDAPDRDAREDAQRRLAEGIERAAHLVDQLLALARVDPDVPTPLGPVDLVDAARLACADEVPLARARGVTLELDAPPRLEIDGDAQALRVLVRNLVDNAIRHSGGRRVDVRVDATADGARLRVDDDGAGIPPEERGRALARFGRRTSSDEPGSGLGLAIVAAAAARHGAALTLGDAPGGGLRVELRFRAAASRGPGGPADAS